MKIDCFKCQHFRVTWDQTNPRGCTAYGFKTKQLPSLVVRQSSGMDCLKFVQKIRQGDTSR
ncbi:uracil-DNA glycosylase [Solibacillus sp. MA9]|uniref:Uracil-DNA glycosylase n=1 Tax=Solibacillus palustris TaxID=2908203 RepID=A0ABS9U844_9BACL|nr:uracil-DNA glycosylase [Solibacillus sp. MA9]MCH7320506.1 uracil-DNA glycosylase [Solibacillus sp. MA9]